MVVELFLGVNQFSWDNIAHFAHLGGAITGLLMILYWRKIKGRY
jgi:membrane associated rhomboid family serine protease